MMGSDFRVSITNPAGKDAYPIASFTCLLIPTEWKDKGKKAAVTDFLNWMLDQGQSMTAQLNYAPLPDSVKEKEKAALAQFIRFFRPGVHATPPAAHRVPVHHLLTRR